jgi:hypothetical protein
VVAGLYSWRKNHALPEDHRDRAALPVAGGLEVYEVAPIGFELMVRT